MQKSITVTTDSKQSLTDITEDVKLTVKESGIKQGLCNVYIPHATSAIIINEKADPNIKEDILDFLAESVREGKWKHDSIDNNGSAHIKSSIIGPSETIPIKGSELCLGRWQDIFLCCFDGPRERKVIITLIGD